MSNFIKRKLADEGGAERASKLERLRNGFAQGAERAALEAEQREKTRQERLRMLEEREESRESGHDLEPAKRGLPPGFAFRRRPNH